MYIPPGRGYFYLLPASLMLATSNDIALPIDYPMGVFVGLISIVSIIIGHITTCRVSKRKCERERVTDKKQSMNSERECV